MRIVVFFFKVRRPEGEAGHSPPSIAEVKKGLHAIHALIFRIRTTPD